MTAANAPGELAYEVFALRYATHIGRKSDENFLGEDPYHATDMPLDFYVWLIRGHGRLVLVDTGFTAETAVRRGRHYHAHPLDLLECLGVAARDITDVIVTHMHYDHAGNLASFPGALIHMQEAEMHYCTGRCMCHPILRKPYEAMDVAAAVQGLFQGRMRYADGDAQIAPGISVHLCGGHTAGLQYVTVATARGEIVLASDAAHYYDNILERRPFPILLDMAAYLDGFERIRQRAGAPDRIIPGHDPLVLSAFPHFRGNPHIAQVHESPVAPLVFRTPAEGQPA
ncbi:MAG: N-acyl homoserine lactonase family protein [Pseudomonadota bacterium]